jgi:ketopantoate reductase
LEHDRIFVGYVTIGKILDATGYSKQTNQKMLQAGEPHPDRNAQFEYINETAAAFLETGDPVISVDTKKKEKIGNFKNDGSEYRAKK